MILFFYFQKKQGNGAWTTIPLGTDHASGPHMIKIKGRTADLYQRQWEFDIQNNTFPVMFRAVRETVDDGDVNLADLKLEPSSLFLSERLPLALNDKVYGTSFCNVKE